jgi:Sec-independent protein secretion pathway component TatC
VVESVYSAVRTDSLYKADLHLVPKRDFLLISYGLKYSGAVYQYVMILPRTSVLTVLRSVLM